MIGFEAALVTILGTWMAGNAHEHDKYVHSKDPYPCIYYVYDPEFLCLGDEDACGDVQDSPCCAPKSCST